MKSNTKKVVQPKQVKQVSNQQVYIGKLYGECACINDARGFQRNVVKHELELSNGTKFSTISVPNVQKKSSIIRKSKPLLTEYLTARMNETYYNEQLQKHLSNTLLKRPTVIQNDAILNDTDFFTKTVNDEKTTYTIQPMTEQSREKLITIAHQQGVAYLERNLKVKK